MAGPGETGDEQAEHRPALQQQAAGPVADRGTGAGPQRHRHIEHAEQQAGTHHAHVRRQDQREEDGNHQGAQVIEGEHLRHQILEGQLALQDAHDQRNLQPDQAPTPNTTR